MNTEEFTTKGKRERVIPINETLYPLLQKRLPKVINIKFDDLVFHKNGFKYNGDYISRKLKKAVRKTAEKLPINPALHFHDLRHSFASTLVKKGVSLFVVKELLGHKDIKTTQIYSHLTVDTLREAVKVLEG
ncbi:MAG: tyrosine-type recombinase/integrase [Ignavibacteriaceae bacterium]